MSEHAPGELARLYLLWAEEHSPRSRRHLGNRIEQERRRCLRELGADACVGVEEAAHAAYLTGWRELMQRNHDGLMLTAAHQLTRIAPEVPRGTGEGDA